MKTSSHYLGTDRLVEAVSVPDVPCADCLVMPKSTYCVQLTDLDPGSELNLAQTSQIKQLAGHKHAGPTATNSRSKQPSKQSELL